jgi:hypothetical protein
MAAIAAIEYLRSTGFMAVFVMLVVVSAVIAILGAIRYPILFDVPLLATFGISG